MTTPQPTNQSEVQLFQVLQRANLLQYYNVFIGQGGDDVRQLCEAGEEEFLEIMALVGMASKPLHVRRLQKALQEWITNPSLFAQNIATMTPSPAAPGSILDNIAHSIAQHDYTSPSSRLPGSSLPGSSLPGSSLPGSSLPSSSLPSSWSPQALTFKAMMTSSVSAPQSPTPSCSGDSNQGMMVIKPEPDAMPLRLVISNGQQSDVFFHSSPSVSPGAGIPSVSPGTGIPVMHALSDNENSRSCSSPPKNFPLYYYNNMAFNSPSHTPNGDHERNSNSPNTATLSDAQIQTIADAAKQLSKTLPNFEPKWMSIKKSLSHDIESLMLMSPDDPMRLERMRTFGAIYGRFDSKRKNEKHMSLHEISVNEASAQLCSLIPALLTRREELFPLARQIVRESGYQYAKGHSRSGKRNGAQIQEDNDATSPIPKKPTLDLTNAKNRLSKLEKEQAYKEARLAKIAKELSEVAVCQEDLKMKIEEAHLNNNYNLVQTLKEELHEQNTKQINLVTAQSELSRKKRPYNRKQPVVEDNDSNKAISVTSPPPMDLTSSLGSRVDFSHFHTMPATVNNTGLKHTLLDEGLRIATQYGMVDFAAELQGLKGQPNSERKNTVTRQQGNSQSTVTPPKQNLQLESLKNETETDANQAVSHDVLDDDSQALISVDSPSPSPASREADSENTQHLDNIVVTCEDNEQADADNVENNNTPNDEWSGVVEQDQSSDSSRHSDTSGSSHLKKRTWKMSNWLSGNIG